MFRFREKASTFFFGLTVGLLIGCAIFIFKLDDYVKNIRFSEADKPEFEETINESPEQNKEAKKKVHAIQQNKKETASTNSDSLSAENSVANVDSAGGVILDGGNYGNDDENISVLKEELVGVKNVKVRGAENGKENKKDSLAASLAGVTESTGNEMIVIEFWKTPLNSKGYKMSRNKVLLYGMQQQNVDIVKLNESYYLKNNNTVYRLSYSNEFKKMEKVNEPAVLARVN